VSIAGWIRTSAHRFGAYALDPLIVAATVALYAVAWPTLHLTHVVPAGVAPAVAALAAFPLLLIRVNPGLGWVISAISAWVVALAIAHRAGSDLPWQVTHTICLIALLCGVVLRGPLVLAPVAWAATALLFAEDMPGPGAAVAWPVGLTGLVVFGLLLRWLVLSRRQLAAQEDLAEVERARRAILEERARIARDLHDVVAHHMSLVVVQAQTAPYRLPDVGADTRAEFESIGRTARSALNEIRTLLGVLRSDGQLPEHAPQPGVGDLADLVRAAERAGMTVGYAVTGDLAPMAQVTAVALYRILQESLANAARHAPGGAVAVRLDGDADAVRLSVRNAVGSAAPPPADARTGNGIAGMRERAEAMGGWLRAGPRPDGEFEVRAQLPRPIPAPDGIGE
jgi:signal transduction histidine kinase